MRWATFPCRARWSRWWPKPPTISSRGIPQDSALCTWQLLTELPHGLRGGGRLRGILGKSNDLFYRRRRLRSEQTIHGQCGVHTTHHLCFGDGSCCDTRRAWVLHTARSPRQTGEVMSGAQHLAVPLRPPPHGLARTRTSSAAL